MALPCNLQHYPFQISMITHSRPNSVRKEGTPRLSSQPTFVAGGDRVLLFVHNPLDFKHNNTNFPAKLEHFANVHFWILPRQRIIRCHFACEQCHRNFAITLGVPRTWKCKFGNEIHTMGYRKRMVGINGGSLQRTFVPSEK